MPDLRLNEFSVLPADKTELKNMWLMYSNGNHYDALIDQDHPLLTMGTITDMELDNQVEDKKEDEGETDVIDSSGDKDKLIKDLKSQVKQKDQGKLQVEQLYREAEEKIKLLQEDKNRLKINVKDLNEYISKKEYIENKAKKVQTKKVCKFFWTQCITVTNVVFNLLSQ